MHSDVISIIHDPSGFNKGLKSQARKENMPPEFFRTLENLENEIKSKRDETEKFVEEMVSLKISSTTPEELGKYQKEFDERFKVLNNSHDLARKNIDSIKKSLWKQIDKYKQKKIENDLEKFNTSVEESSLAKEEKNVERIKRSNSEIFVPKTPQEKQEKDLAHQEKIELENNLHENKALKKDLPHVSQEADEPASPRKRSNSLSTPHDRSDRPEVLRNAKP